MTKKERLLASMKGEKTDKIPFSPFLAYFWEHQPKSIQDQGQVRFLENIGADPLLRGFHVLFKTTRIHCEIFEKVDGKEKQITYESHVGSLNEKYIFAPQANSWYLLEHPVKTEEDFRILTYIYENTTVEQEMAQFLVDYHALGSRGLYLPLLGTECKTCFQSLIEHWVGTEELVYALADYPETVLACLEAMKKPALKTVEISMDSPAEAFLFFEDSSTTNVSPDFFEKYIAPEISAWADIVHKAGKILVHHACGHIRDLVRRMETTGIDVIESITPPPTGNIEPWEIKQAVSPKISLIGGIDPVFLLHCNLEELDGYVENLIQRMGPAGFILANADSCPPGVTVEKFKRISELSASYHM